MDTMNSYKCPCCGAPLVFLGEELHCDSCGNSFAVDAINEMNDGMNQAGKESRYDWDRYEPRTYGGDEGVNLANYSCKSCGAEITGDDTLGATVCPYCGQSTIVKGQFEGALRPDYIIPFKVDKKAAMNAFYEASLKAPFLPDSFRDKKKIEEMAGIYVPFWMFDCDCDAYLTYNAQRVTTWSDANYRYTKTDFYKLLRQGGVGFANIPVDGSKKADDTYMEAVEPFDYNDAVEFNGAYLSGYLADKYDVSHEDSIGRANERVKNSTVQAFSHTTAGYLNVVPEGASVSFSNGKTRYALLPVWMLNIRYQEENFQYAINGQTGKVVGKWPVDKKKKWNYFWKVAAIAGSICAVIAYILLQ